MLTTQPERLKFWPKTASPRASNEPSMGFVDITVSNITGAEFWCNLQSAHELSVVAATKRQELAHIIPHGQRTAAAALS